jgi:hypothetical protein
MNSTDPASLQNLNDIVLPAPVGWWPLASGWYFLLGLSGIVITWFVYRSIRRWIKNRYRREALHELSVITNGVQDAATRERYLRQIPSLLKRTALTAYPRGAVASLSGKDWHRFLNSTLKSTLFTDPVTGTLDIVSYSSTDLSELDSNSVTDLLQASGHWLKHHQAMTDIKGSEE